MRILEQLKDRVHQIAQAAFDRCQALPGCCRNLLERTLQDFLITILSEAERPQTSGLSPRGEFWVCSEANCRVVKNSFQRAKGDLGNKSLQNDKIAQVQGEGKHD
jgi:hypothetical protein